MSESATVLQPGDKVGDSYEVEKLIGRGGMGEVWAARHLRLVNKQVAVKVLHTRGTALSAEQLARFKREADVATRINHPNIVEVHDYNTLPDGSPYLVLELLQGESLASRLRFGPMSVEEATQVVRQVGAALDASHRLGVVHRDLKPDNVFLVSTPVGTQVKVLDFGISKVVDSTTLQTAEAVLVGTPQYMSPEQAVGANKDVGPQTDIFALGSIAYEMLAGAPAFVADSVAKVVFRIAYEKHTPLESVKPGLPARLYTAVEGALEKDRAKRYADVGAFVAEFTGQPLPRTLPPPPSTDTRAPSGVASPGMATPDSMAWGATAAPTPLPSPHAPAVAPSQRAAPLPGRVPLFIVGGVALLALVAAALALVHPPPPPPPPPPLPLPALPVVPTAPPMAVEAVEAPVDAGTVALAPKAVSGHKRLPPEDAEIIRDMEDKLKKKDPYERCLQRMRDLASPEGLSRGYAIVTMAACSERILSSARAQYEKVEERADRQEAAAFCRKFSIELQ